MKFADRSYYKAYDHNYRVAYEEGFTYLGDGASQKGALNRLDAMLRRVPHSPTKTEILDVGCGDGTVGIFLSGLGYRYLGIDVSEAAIERARQRCVEAGADAGFRAANALEPESFPASGADIVLDCSCFHMLVVDAHRKIYLRNVRRALRDVMLGDDLRAVIDGEPNEGVGIEAFRFVLFGEPSAASRWAAQLDGHHVALNVSLDGDAYSLSPSFIGTYPQVFTVAGVKLRPLGAETDLAHGLAGSDVSWAIQGPSIVMEYANDARGGADAGNPADHVHTVYRDLDRDLGR